MGKNVLVLDNSAMQSKGNEHFVHENTGRFAKGLVDGGNQVRFFGFSVEHQSTVSYFPLTQNGIKVTSIARSKLKIFSYIKLFASFVVQLLRCDFVYVFAPSHMQYVCFICWLLGKPYGLYIRGQQGIKSRSFRLILRHSQLVNTVSDGFTNYSIKHQKNKNAYTIKPMINFGLSDRLVGQRNFHGSSLKLLFLARIQKDKGVFELLEAASILKAKGLDFKLKVVGDGMSLDELRAGVEQYQLADRIILIGSVFDKNSIREFYTWADMYILPSYHEGFPRTLYEAMLFGTPILTTMVGGIPYLLKNLEHCVQIDVKSADSIASAVIFLSNRKDLMNLISKNNLTLIQEVLGDRREHVEIVNDFIKGGLHVEDNEPE